MMARLPGRTLLNRQLAPGDALTDNLKDNCLGRIKKPQYKNLFSIRKTYCIIPTRSGETMCSPKEAPTAIPARVKNEGSN